jgi:hypothetical protein
VVGRLAEQGSRAERSGPTPRWSDRWDKACAACQAGPYTLVIAALLPLLARHPIRTSQIFANTFSEKMETRRRPQGAALDRRPSVRRGHDARANRIVPHRGAATAGNSPLPLPPRQDQKPRISWPERPRHGGALPARFAPTLRGMRGPAPHRLRRHGAVGPCKAGCVSAHGVGTDRPQNLAHPARYLPVPVLIVFCFPTTWAAGFRLERSYFSGPVSPGSSPGQSLPLRRRFASGELPATSDARFRAAFRSRSTSCPHASQRKTRSSSGISSLI